MTPDTHTSRNARVEAARHAVLCAYNALDDACNSVIEDSELVEELSKKLDAATACLRELLG